MQLTRKAGKQLSPPVNRRRPLAGVDLAHKKFKVSETQLKLFFTQPTKHTKRGAQNRDKHTCTTQMLADDDGLEWKLGTGGQGSGFQDFRFRFSVLGGKIPRKSQWQTDGKAAA